MTFQQTTLAGSYIIEPQIIGDERGWFMRTYCDDEFKQINHTLSWQQMNQTFTSKKGSIRGMHFQLPPYQEIKLVRCIRGSIYDVIIDLRAGSPTFLQYFGIELSSENKKALYIPMGFAHGFQTLENNVELIYNHSQFYTPKAERGINFADTKIGIQWPKQISQISEKDKLHPFIDENFKGI